MLHDHLETPTSVDAKTAEEALSLALRLQQERGERVSIEELQRTADEAGIDRVYLEGALQQVARNAQQKDLKSQDATAQRRRILAMTVALMMAMVIFVIGNVSPDLLNSPRFVAPLAIAFFVLLRIARTGRPSLFRRRFRGP